MVSFPFSGGPDLRVLLLSFLIFNTVLAVVAGSFVYKDATRCGKTRAYHWGVLVGALFLLNIMTGVFGLFAYYATRD